MGFCSAVTLAFATIFSLVAAALLAIAFSTDNWVTIQVERDELKTQLLQVISDFLGFPSPLPVSVAQQGKIRKCRLQGFNNYISLSTANCAICTI